MGQIQISNEFFKKERNAYSSWQDCFFRELIQNSVDAGAKNIDISLKRGEEGHTLVKFTDDGCGFNSDVRDNVFFFLGKTNKGEGSIGGFGKARIVVCFSQHSYEIISQDWRCTGSGSSFETYPNSYTKGCSVIVDVDTTGSMREMEYYLYNYLMTTQMNCNISIESDVSNVEERNFTNWCHKRRLAKRLSFGNVYVNKNGNYKGYLIVRVSGVTMFKRYISSSNVQVILEIDPDCSRKILLSNRDMLHQKYQDELDMFIQRLAVDTQSALRNTHKRFYFLQGNPKITRRKRKREKEKVKILNTDIVFSFIPGQSSTRLVSPDAKDTIEAGVRELRTEYDRHIIDDIIPSAVVLSETENPKVRKVVPRYNPVNWENGGGSRKKLLKQWTTICNYVVEEYLDMSELEEISWRPGFVFSDDAGAMYIKNQDVACFMLNPVDKNGKIAFGLRNKKSWKTMIIRACHEVAHYVEEYHNERFVSVSENLIERVIFNDSKIFRSLLNVLKVSVC